MQWRILKNQPHSMENLENYSGVLGGCKYVNH